VLLLLLVLLSVAFSVNKTQNHITLSSTTLWMVYGILMAVLLFVFLKPDIHAYILPERIWFDKNHFWLALFALFAGAYTWLQMKKDEQSKSVLARIQLVVLLVSVISGILMLVKFSAIYNLVALAYSVFDVAVAISVVASIIWFINYQIKSLQVETA
jgi:hypothetical protein